MIKFYYSHSQDPYYHLGLEDHYLREYSEEDEFFILYQNNPSIVMGRFQNPWIEVDLNWLKNNHLNLVRRMSGGGTVYHDLGNVNFAYIGPLKGFKKEKALNMIKEKLALLGINVEINARFDLTCGGKKVSGSAYKQTKDRVLHHFTLLISANLDHLEKSLHSPHKIKVTKAIPSVRSSVLNLIELNPQLDFKKLIDVFMAKEIPPKLVSDSWKNEDWLWGETPYFEWEFKLHDVNFILESRKGKIEKCSHFKDHLIENESIKGEWLKAEIMYNSFHHLYPTITLKDWEDLLGH